MMAEVAVETIASGGILSHAPEGHHVVCPSCGSNAIVQTGH